MLPPSNFIRRNCISPLLSQAAAGRVTPLVDHGCERFTEVRRSVPSAVFQRDNPIGGGGYDQLNVGSEPTPPPVIAKSAKQKYYDENDQ
jgi:hypothetical protein